MSLSRQRERKRPFPPKKFVSVQVPIIPYYQRYRYEQEVKGLKDRDELELYPEDTRIFTENVIKRVFAREMVWDGYKWVRRHEFVPYGEVREYYNGSISVPNAVWTTVLEIEGKGFLIEAWVRYPVDSGYFSVAIDGFNRWFGWNLNSWRTIFGWVDPQGFRILQFDPVNERFTICYAPSTPIPYSRRLTIELNQLSGSTVNAMVRVLYYDVETKRIYKV